jgi:ammonia channel protein AmtB
MALSMKANVSYIRWGIIALLSFIVAAVAFAIPCPPLVIGLVPVTIISGSISFLKYTKELDRAGSFLFDDYGYC